MINNEEGKIALLGATGAIGKSIADALRKQSRSYRVIGRSQPTLHKEFGDDPLAEIVLWNPEDKQSIERALNGVSAVVYLVGVPYTQFHLHPILMSRVVDAAIAQNVDRLLLIGTLYAFGRRQTERIKEDHQREPHTFKGQKRKEQEDVVMAAHTGGKIKTTILRLPDFYGPGVERSFLSDMFIAAKQKRKAKMIGPVDLPHEFVFVPDVGPVAARILDTPEAFGRSWHLGGAGVITQIELARMAFEGDPRYMAVGKTMLRLLGIFDPMLRELVEMHYLLTEPLIVDDSALQKLLGGISKTPYSEGVRQSLAAVA